MSQICSRQEYAALSALTDEELIARYQGGDELSLTELYIRYKDKLRVFAESILLNREDAEDAVQDTFVNLCRYKHYYKPVYRFSTWLYKINLNKVRTCLRKRKSHNYEYLDDLSLVRGYMLVDPGIDDRCELLAEIVDLINRTDMKSIFKNAILLVAVIDISYEDAADILEVPLGTLKSRVNRARIKVLNNAKREGLYHLLRGEIL